MSKNLILFLLISFCSFSGGINGKSIEESLEEICDRISHCRSDEEEKKSSIQEILDNSLYEFNYKDENVVFTCKSDKSEPFEFIGYCIGITTYCTANQFKVIGVHSPYFLALHKTGRCSYHEL